MTASSFLPVYLYFTGEFPHWKVTIDDQPDDDEQAIDIKLTRSGHHNFCCDDVRFVNLLLRNRLMVAAFSVYVSHNSRMTYIHIRLRPIPICLIIPTN